MAIWDIDPILLQLGPVQIRYYGICFLITILGGYYFWRGQNFSSQSPHVRRTGSWLVLDGGGFAQASESLLFASRVLNTAAPVSSTNTLAMTGYSTYSGIADTTVATWIKEGSSADGK